MLNALGLSSAPPQDPQPGDTVEANFVKVAVALNQHSKAVMDLRGQLARLESGHTAALDQIAKTIAGLQDRAVGSDRGGVDRLASAFASLRDHFSKLDAHCASNFDALSKAAAVVNERMEKLESELSAMRPRIEAMKVHAESFPHALREARRSDVAVQDSLKAIEARLARVESKLAKPARRTKP